MYMCTFQTSVSCFSPPRQPHLSTSGVSDNLPIHFTITHKLEYFKQPNQIFCKTFYSSIYIFLNQLTCKTAPMFFIASIFVSLVKFKSQHSVSQEVTGGLGEGNLQGQLRVIQGVRKVRSGLQLLLSKVWGFYYLLGGHILDDHYKNN